MVDRSEESKSDNKSSGKSALSKTCNVYVRIRPQAFDGSGHDQNGQAVAKSLDDWGTRHVTLSTEYMFSKGSSKYTFPELVFGPEA